MNPPYQTNSGIDRRLEFHSAGNRRLFLPILQGVLFLLVGLIILSSQYAWAHLLLSKIRERFPKLGRTADAGHRQGHEPGCSAFLGQPKRIDAPLSAVLTSKAANLASWLIP